VGSSSGQDRSLHQASDGIVVSGWLALVRLEGEHAPRAEVGSLLAQFYEQPSDAELAPAVAVESLAGGKATSHMIREAGSA